MQKVQLTEATKATELTDAATKETEKTAEEKVEEKVESKVDETAAVSKDDVLISLTLDLSSLQSVYDFVESFIGLNLGKTLTLVVNNAGVMALDTWKGSKDGYEMQFATNVLGHFYLSLLLINHFEKDLRIVNVSSSAH